MAQNDSIIKAVEAYFRNCSLLKKGAFRVDFLGISPVEYSIDVLPVDPIMKRYADGSSVRQYQFAFSSREFYSMDRIQNIKNSSFYEKFSDWVESKNKSGDLPALPDGMESEKLIVMSSGYLFDSAGKNARYTIQLNLIYFKEAIQDVQ